MQDKALLLTALVAIVGAIGYTAFTSPGGGGATTEARICAYNGGADYNPDCLRPSTVSKLYPWDSTDKQAPADGLSIQPAEQRHDPVSVKSNEMQPAAKYGTYQPQRISE